MEEVTTWEQVASKLRLQGWTVDYRPLPGLPPYAWRSPDGLSGSDYRSNHPDAPPEAVMREAYRRGEVEFTQLGPA